MPWKAADAKRFKKGLSSDQAKKWAAVANRVLKDTGDEGKAVRVANSQVKKKKGKSESYQPFSKPFGNGQTVRVIKGTTLGGK